MAKKASKPKTRARTRDDGGGGRSSVPGGRNASGDDRAAPGASGAPPPPPGNGGNGGEPRPGNGNGHALPVPTSPPTEEEIAAASTAEQLALRILAAKISGKVLNDMSALFDELIGEKSHLLDDDDEEDDGWIDDRRERERALLEEGIADVLEECPDFTSINLSAPLSDPDITRDAEKLREVLVEHPALGATTFEDRFSREQIQRMVRRDIKVRFKRDTKYNEHVADEVPGSDMKRYGSRGRTTSKGTFSKTDDFESGGGLAALFTGGWMRVAKDRIDPDAWSHQHGGERKTERKNWRQVFRITEKDGRKSVLEVPREKLAGDGSAALKLLAKAGVHVVHRARALKALVRFLRFKPKREIIRLQRPGWDEIDGYWVFVRPDEVITPPGMPTTANVSYVLESSVTQHGLHVAGTVEEWKTGIAATVRGNSNVALSFGTFFAAPLLHFASEPGGGNQLFGRSTIGKTMVSDLGQTIYGWPHETADDAFGVSWGGTEAGFDALALARADLGLPLDEITLSDPRTAEQIVYKVALGTKGPRATSTGQLRETTHAYVLVLSTGEKSLAEFIPHLQEGARKRLVDVPAEVQPGSAFETIPPAQLHIEGKRLFEAMKRQHGAVGRAWQRHLVNLGPAKIKEQLHEHCEAFLALPEVLAVAEKAHPSVKAVVNRFALYAAALHMAIEAGLLPWTVAEADAGIAACMNRWVQQLGNIDTAGELVRGANEIIASIKTSLPDRFIGIHKMKKGGWSPVTDADKAKQATSETFDGYAKPDRILVRSEAWKQFCHGFDPAEVATYLRRQGKLIAEGERLTRAEQVIGRVERFYVLTLTALTA
jgi:putative DNA primase/helicase